MARLIPALPLLLLNTAWLVNGAQVTIIDSGSTNVPGMNIKMESAGTKALLQHRDGSTRKVKFAKDLCARLMADIKAAGPLNALPASHCMKSASFGTSLFIEYDGRRSPDLSCRQVEPHAAALQKDANEILSAARATDISRYDQ